MVKAKVIPLFDRDPAFERLIETVERSDAVPAAIYGRVLKAFRPSVYRSGQHCANCGRQAWHIQRTVAECGKCGEVLPLG